MSEIQFFEAVFGGYFGEGTELPRAFADEIDDGLAMIEPRYAEIIRERFGLGKTLDVRLSLKAIGKTVPRADGGVGVTPERVRQMEARALRLLRHPDRMGHLKEKIEELQERELGSVS